PLAPPTLVPSSLWDALAAEPGLRLFDVADLGRRPPARVVRTPARSARAWSTDRQLPVVAILDPRVPGFRADSALGSVLGRVSTPTPLTGHLSQHLTGGRLRPEADDAFQLLRRPDLDRARPSNTLRDGASR